MSGKPRAVTSREYKVMLHVDKFIGGQCDMLAAANGFCDALTLAVRQIRSPYNEESLVKGRFEVPRGTDRESVQFLDTKDRRLRSSSLIFRRRQSLAGGRLELTLKLRHPDRFFASGSSTGGKTKFEEDIKASQTNAFVSLYSLSGKVEGVDADTDFKTLKCIREFYNPLKSLLGAGYTGSEKLLRVCNFTALQTVFEGVEIQVGKRARAQCALIFWHSAGDDSQTPAVVEFSFRCRGKDLGSKREPFSVEIARHCFEVLQVLRAPHSPVASWVDLGGLTKTAYAYGITRT